MRQLKYHEQKLLKKVDFFQWKSDNTQREIQVMRRYHVQNREDYHRYNKICGQIRQLANKIALLDPKDPFRAQMTNQLLEKLYSMAIIPTKTTLSSCEKVSVSAICRRRLPVLLMRLKMAESVKQAVMMVEQGHVRVGPDVVTDPAYLVNKSLEDFVTWVDTSPYKKKILKYHDKLDDFDLLE